MQLVNKKRTSIICLRWVIALSASLALAAAASATPLGLTKAPLPATPADAYSDFINVSYNATTHAFSASGFAEAIDVTNSPPPDDYDIFSDAQLDPGGFTINASITNAGGLTSGTFQISGFAVPNGAFPPIPNSTAILLSGNLTQLGYASGSSIFEFVGSVTGGDAASKFGSQVGIILDAKTALSASLFNASYQNTVSAQNSSHSDTFTVPEPTTCCLGLMAAGCIGLLYLLRR
jgi:hypothetical protein